MSGRPRIDEGKRKRIPCPLGCGRLYNGGSDRCLYCRRGDAPAWSNANLRIAPDAFLFAVVAELKRRQTALTAALREATL